MLKIKGVACLFMAALAVPHSHAAKLKPDEDGMSLGASFHVKLEVMHTKNMESMKGKPPPPPPTPDNSTPCFLGGDDCSEYETFSPCSDFKCNKDPFFPFCEASPTQEGTICGKDGDYFEFDTCNTGPGFCKTVESDYGDFGICVGIPKLGADCNDYNECTKEDKCKVVLTDDGAFRGQCMGKFAGEIPCNDYNDYCTTNDRCQLVSSDEGDFTLCRGDLLEGKTCNDYNDCTAHDQCISITPTFPPFDDGVRCQGTLLEGKTCNDYNDCTVHDECMEVSYGGDYTFPGCRGQATPGEPCDDYFDGTTNDVCKEYDYGTFCVGDYNR